MPSRSKLQITRHLLALLSKLLLVPLLLLRIPNPPGRGLKLGRQVTGWVVNFQNNHRSAMI